MKTQLQQATDVMRYRVRKKLIKILRQLKDDMILTTDKKCMTEEIEKEIGELLEGLKPSSFKDKSVMMKLY